MLTICTQWRNQTSVNIYRLLNKKIKFFCVLAWQKKPIFFPDEIMKNKGTEAGTHMRANENANRERLLVFAVCNHWTGTQKEDLSRSFTQHKRRTRNKWNTCVSIRSKFNSNCTMEILKPLWLHRTGDLIGTFDMATWIQQFRANMTDGRLESLRMPDSLLKHQTARNSSHSKGSFSLWTFNHDAQALVQQTNAKHFRWRSFQLRSSCGRYSQWKRCKRQFAGPIRGRTFSILFLFSTIRTGNQRHAIVLGLELCICICLCHEREKETKHSYVCCLFHSVRETGMHDVFLWSTLRREKCSKFCLRLSGLFRRIRDVPEMCFPGASEWWTQNIKHSNFQQTVSAPSHSVWKIVCLATQNLGVRLRCARGQTRRKHRVKFPKGHQLIENSCSEQFV